ncbi:MAG: hypothetical protein IEMM0006_1660 [bacterium]|nr:MAG: hypothetical protein IEMM0006_1660 [bacterium]
MPKPGKIGSLPQNRMKAILLSLFLLFSFPLFAQFYNGSNMTFGKNRVQYKQFLWTYYKFPDFDIYFYRNGRPLANFVSEYASEEIPKMESKMGVDLNKKIKFIVFNTLNDMKQTNIGLIHDGNSVEEGGLNTVLQYKTLLYFDGSYPDFETKIRKGIAGILYNQMATGSQGMVQQLMSSSKVFAPPWFELGYISYITEDWNADFDNRLRDGILSGRFKRLDDLSTEDAVCIGHSFWRFIAIKYGKTAVNNIVRMTAIAKNLNKGFLNVIGLKYKQVRKEWYQFYEKAYQPYAGKDNLPHTLLPLKYKSDVRLLQPVPGPTGTNLAYVSNLSGKYKILLYDFRTKKSREIFKKGQVIETPVDYRYPILAWHPSGQVLAFVIEVKGLPWLYFYDIRKKRITKLLLVDMQKVLSMSYSEDGRYILMSAIQNGQSDIFVFNVAARSFNKITNDIAADLHPVFIDHGQQILFSSNRINDTLDIKPTDDHLFSQHFDLFLYDYRHNNPVLKRLTHTPGQDETQPEAYGPKTFRYLSDANGIYNARLGVVDSTVSSVDTTIHYRYFINTKPVTNYSRNIIEQHVSLNAGKLAEVILDDNHWKIFVENTMDFADAREIKPVNTPFVTERLKVRERERKMPDQNLVVTTAGPGTQRKRSWHRKHFRMLYLDKNDKEIVAGRSSQENKNLLGGYFGEAPGTNGYRDKYGHFIFPKRRNYYTEYSYNGMVTKFNYNYLSTFYQPYTGNVPSNTPINMGYKLGISDLMEDHRFIGGFRLNSNFIDNEYTFSYANYKKRLNREILFHRNTVTQSSRYFLGKILSHELYYIMTWPFNENLSLHGVAHYRNDMYVLTATDAISLNAPTHFENWIGFTTSLVYDGTKRLGLNLYTGSRWKVFLEYNQMLDKKNRNLIVTGFDYRYYHRIYRHFIWALRLAGSSSFGTDRLIYFMGGVDNWLNPKYNTTTPVDPSHHYAYRALAVNMRGFPQNIRNGSSFMLLNTELRIPVFQMLSETPLSSNLLRNFQVVTFADVGTAWTGLTPYSKGNTLFTNMVNSGPIYAKVITQKEPVVEGFGFGFRINLFGYFLRTDVAWGVEDGVITPKPIWYWSLNLDF